MYVMGELGPDKIPTSFTLVEGLAFPGTPGLDWRINGLQGTIRVTAPGPFLQMGYGNEAKIELLKSDTGDLQIIDDIARDEFDEWPAGDFPYNPAMREFAFQNMSRVYRLLASGGSNCTWEDAVEQQNLLEELYRQNGYKEV